VGRQAAKFPGIGLGRVKILQSQPGIIAVEGEFGCDGTGTGCLRPGQQSPGLGTAIDKLVQIGHNVRIGCGCILARLDGLTAVFAVGG